jgi:shikimate dehydrogenase
VHPTRIVTLPGRSVDDLRAQLGVAELAGAELAEIRVDRLSGPERQRLAELFPAPIGLIATLRSRAEGGEGPDDPAERAGLLAEIAALPFAAVDWEGARDLPLRSEARTIVSFHEVALDSEGIRRKLSERFEGSWFVKVVVPATVGEAISTLLPVLPPAGENRFVFHTTGASGPLLRGWSEQLGMAAVYCSLPTAAGIDAVEVSQIPVDRIRQFTEAPGPARLFAVLGQPVAHSLSPAIHSRWFAAARRRGLYLALEIGSDHEFAEALPGLISGGFTGVNVTHPWKRLALELSEESSLGAERCGCANTLVFDAGSIRAENTDLVAVLRRLEELQSDGSWAGERLVVLGAGGAARATLAAAEAVGARATVASRRPEEAVSLAREFGQEARAWSDPVRCDLVVHATPIGRSSAGDPPPSISDWIAPAGRVLDFVYRPERTTVAEAAARAGGSYEDGWRLLVYQAAESYRIWWGVAPPERTSSELLQEGPSAG